MKQNFFETAAPQEAGINPQYLMNFLKVLEDQELPIHGALLLRHGKLIMESYYAPYKRETLHRMFSQTKSFVSLAIGLLIEENKLSLDDTIVSYFPEKLPEEGVHPYTAMMTIRDLLMMSSAHDKTTYKTLKSDDWVKTFFVVEPTHVPGTCFSYDTSATHTLSALVEKLSGMELLAYLKLKLLKDLDIAEDSYCMKDPAGVSMGGSGLMARPMDMLKVMYVISQNGIYNGKQLLPEKYLKDACTNQVDNFVKGGSYEEMQGYGYQIWRIRNNGVAFFGMGGQLTLWYPDKDMILAVTADAQGRQGGVQLIYDAFWNEVYFKTDDGSTSNITAEEFNQFCTDRKMLSLKGRTSSVMTSAINHVCYKLDSNKMGFTDIKLSLNENEKCGEVTYTHTSGTHTLHFNMESNCIEQFPVYDYKCANSGIWRSNNTFLIKSQIIDEAIGHVYIQLTFKGNYVTVIFKKVEETMFNEYDGFISGIAIK